MCTFDLLNGEAQLKVGNSDCTICFQPTLPNYCKTLPKTFTVSLVLNVVLGKATVFSVKYADLQVLLNSLECSASKFGQNNELGWAWAA